MSECSNREFHDPDGGAVQPVLLVFDAETDRFIGYACTGGCDFYCGMTWPGMQTYTQPGTWDFEHGGAAMRGE